VLPIEVNKNTRLYGLLGYPIGHSLSPAIQNAGFAALGMNKAYFLMEVRPENLGAAVQGMKVLPFGGGNVTIPHKVEVMRYLDEISDAARLIGAVNVIRIEDGRALGFNTDGSGFFRSFRAEAGITPEGRVFFLNGAGGAARAVAVEAVLRGAKKLYLCNRTFEKAEALARDINEKLRPCVIPLHQEQAEMEEAMADTEVVVNTTSLGMHPRTDELSLDPGLLNPRIIVCDCVYNPERTRLLREAAALGCRTVTGVGMLLNQGVESFELWTGAAAPVAVMLEALRNALDKL
jgi:shikimate dehydrogenase